MTTKWLLLVAFIAQTVATASAQVYSVNAVGYVNVSLEPGFNLVANPLLSDDNSIGNLFKNMQMGVPSGTRVYKMVNGAFITVLWDDFDEKFVPEANAAQQCLPGDGVYVYLGGSEERKLTFVGQVLQGDVCTHIPRGCSIKSNPIPQALDFRALNFPGGTGDKIYRFNKATGNFETHQFDELENRWPALTPIIPVGEAFIVYRAGAATDWCRRFFVNNPL